MKGVTARNALAYAAAAFTALVFVFAAVPKLIDSSNTWTVVTTGRTHACGVTAGGQQLCWGANTGGCPTGSLPSAGSASSRATKC